MHFNQQIERLCEQKMGADRKNQASHRSSDWPLFNHGCTHLDDVQLGHETVALLEGCFGKQLLLVSGIGLHSNVTHIVRISVWESETPLGLSFALKSPAGSVGQRIMEGLLRVPIELRRHAFARLTSEATVKSRHRQATKRPMTAMQRSKNDAVADSSHDSEGVGASASTPARTRPVAWLWWATRVRIQMEMDK